MAGQSPLVCGGVAVWGGVVGGPFSFPVNIFIPGVGSSRGVLLFEYNGPSFFQECFGISP